MKKYISFLLLLVIASITTKGQENQIAVGLVTDNVTKLTKSFALYDLLTKNPISSNGTVLKPIIADFPYNASVGIEGMVYENNVNLKLYHNGKKIKDIKCGNDWEVINNAILTELQKVGSFTQASKFQKILEGKQANFYSRSIVDNLPGSLSIQVPNSKSISLKSINANIIKFSSKNPYEEIKEIYGKFGTADITDIAVFKNPGVPENFVSSVKPLVYPVSKTMTYSLKMLGYGDYLTEQKDENAALNCFYTALNTSKGILASPKELAVLKSFAFKGIGDIYNGKNNKPELAKLYAFGYDLNNDFSNSNTAEKLNETYYTSISKVKALCQNVEAQTKIAKSAMGLMILGSISNGLSSSSLATSSGIDFSSITNNLNMVTSQSANIQQASTQFFNQLSQSGDLVNAESFIVDGVDLKSDNNYVSADVLFYLMNYPLEIKNTLLDFAKDKPKLNKLILNFYHTDNADKSKLIQEIYLQCYKIEMVIIGLEARNKVVEEKYKASF